MKINGVLLKPQKKEKQSLEDEILSWNLESLSIPQLKKILENSRITLKIYLAWQVMANKMEKNFPKR